MSTSPLRIEYLPLAALKPYERNARTHSPDQVAQLAASMREFGWTNPILVDEASNIIAGHGRLSAAAEVGLVEVPTIRLVGLTEPQRRALALADNKLALNAGWDEKLLVAELQGIGDLQPLVGFSADELLRLLGGHGGLTDPDEVPEPPAEPVTQPGDVWLLGAHRLVCGDATVPGDVALALVGVAPNLMVTDPPYGVEYDADWRNHAFRADGTPIAGRAIGPVTNDERLDWREAWALFPGDICYCWHADRHASAVQQSLEAAAFTIRCQIIWAKTRFVISRGDYHWQHEPCWYAVRKKGQWTGDRSQTTLWTIAHNKSETGHSAQKPVECMRRPIENNSSPGQAVYDPFVGSGTTIIAGEMTGRACHALEISPTYCDVAVTRWENFTGRKAERQPYAAAA
jgi:DNA modification methylase